MKLLLRKDLPWILFFLVGGTIGLTLAVCERSFVNTFVAPWGNYEALFHVAWSCGLGLGIVAAGYDEVLGTREFLEQRPVPAARIVNARLAGCAIVLLGWTMFAPVGAWITFAFTDEYFEVGHWSGVPMLWGTILPAWSACAVGCAAVALPVAWWWRLVAAAALLFAVLLGVEVLSRDDERLTSAAAYVLTHAAAIVACVVMTRVAAPHRVDRDRPLPRPVRTFAVGPVLLAAAALWTLACTEWASTAVMRLQNAYPRVLVAGTRVLLVADHRRGGHVVVDAEHRPTGEALPRDAVEARRSALPILVWRSEGMDNPRWMGGSRSGWLREHMLEVLLAPDGTAWLRPVSPGPLRTTGRGPAHEPFEAGSELHELDQGAEDWVVVLERRARALWRFDEKERHFVPLPLPGDDRPVHVGWMVSSRLATVMVRGERGAYALQGGALVEVEAPMSAQALVGGPDADPIVCTVDRTIVGAPFRHEFVPRTAVELFYAGTAVLCSMLRPPVLQTMSTLSVPEAARYGAFEDPLVANGRRPWLVAVCLGIALLLAWRVSARLARLGSARSARVFWVVATLLLGLPAAAASFVFERPRAWAVRTLPAPRTPRIVTPVSEEVPA